MAGWFAVSALNLRAFGLRGVLAVAGALLAYAGARLFDQGYGQHEILEDVFGTYYVAMAALSGLVWSACLTRLKARRVASMLLILPAVLLVGWKFEEQRIPRDACSSEGVTVHIGQVAMFVPWGMSAQLNWDGTGTHLPYSADRNDKPFVKRMCRETAGGREPIFASSLEIAPLETAELCASSPELPGCSAPGVFEDLQVVRITAAGKGRLASEVKWLEQEQPKYADFKGDVRSGHVCFDDGSEFGITHCRLWRPFGPNQTVQLDAQGKRPAGELLAQLAGKIEPLRGLMQAETP